MKRVAAVLVTVSLLLAGCSPADPWTEPTYFRDSLYTWNGTAYNLITSNVSGGSGNGSGVTDHALLTNLDFASSGHTGFQALLGFTPENSANKGIANGYASLNATGKVPSSQIDFPASTTAWGSVTGTLSNQTDLQSALDAKQATLVSGTNIKTVNGSTLLGAGDLVVSAGDHSHTADNITGGSDNQTILSVGGKGSWTTLIIEHISGLVASLAAKLDATGAAIITALGYTPADNVTAQAHYSSTSNPHSVTKAQVGLSDVSNVAQADNTTAVAHYNNTSNPHSTTAAQVGALPTANVSVTAAASKVPSANASGKIDNGWLTQNNGTVAGIVPASGGGTTNFYRADGTWAAPPGGTSPVTKVITANSATTSTSLTEIGGLYVTLAANTNYLIEAGWNETVSAVTTGIRYGVGANFTLTSMELQLVGRIAGATVGMERISANNTATANAFATVSGSTNNAVNVSGIVRVGASGGNFSFKHLKVTSGTATALALGWIRATPISVP